MAYAPVSYKAKEKYRMFDLDKFFRVFTTTDLPDGTTVRVRVLSDIELKARDEHSLSVVAKMTEALKDPKSEDYQNKIATLDMATDESLIETLVGSWKDEWAREARDLFRVDFYPYPDKSTDAEKVETDKRQKEHEITVFTERAKFLLGREKNFREKAAEWDRDTLLRQTKLRAISLFALNAGMPEQVYWTVWRATENEDGTTYWDSVDDVRGLSSRIIDKIMSSYREVDAQDPWALTKSKSARSSRRLGKKRSNGGSKSVQPAQP